MYYRVTGQEIYAEWKEKELRVKELVKKIYKIEGEIEFKDVKTVLSKKLGYAEDRIKAIKFKNSPAIHKKVESIFSDNSEKEFDEKIEKIISEEVKEVKETEKDKVEKERILKKIDESKIKEKFIVKFGEYREELAEGIYLDLTNLNKNFVAVYTDEKESYVLKCITNKVINLKKFLENIIFETEKEVIIEKEIKIIKNLNEFSKFLLENELLFSGNEIMIATTLEKFKFEELEERFNVKLEI